MIIGYARTSTVEQQAGFEAQFRDLQAHGCDKIFSEQVSSVNSQRLQLEQAMDFAREGDVLVVTRLDRLARSIANLTQIVASLENKKVGLRILDMSIDTNTPTGRLLINLVGSIAQFEREIMLARQREGIAKAKDKGLFKGRAPTARRKSDFVMQLIADGKKPTDIAKELNIGRSSVYRIIAEHDNQSTAG
ncbi:recombinase family protein [Pseudochrobactrum asaccharolyticum]|uniref:recombinase family protein n=1 Tax=Pseudochrobactrum asaccharolyticum TaxID=354351 RepID=UPI004042FD05